MTFPTNVERWREFVRYEARDIPENLVLALIQKESNGVAGATSPPREPARRPIQKADGTIGTNAEDRGLMQVAPVTVESWNQRQDPKITLEDLTGTDERSARLQIRIGCWAFAQCVGMLNKYDPATFDTKSASMASKDHLLLALVAYGAGPGELRRRLDALRAAGQPLTWDAFAAANAGWQGLVGARRAWALYQGPADVVSISTTGPAQVEKKSPLERLSSLPWLPILAIAALLYWQWKRRRDAEDYSPLQEHEAEAS